MESRLAGTIRVIQIAGAATKRKMVLSLVQATVLRIVFRLEMSTLHLH